MIAHSREIGIQTNRPSLERSKWNHTATTCGDVWFGLLHLVERTHEDKGYSNKEGGWKEQLHAPFCSWTNRTNGLNVLGIAKQLLQLRHTIWTEYSTTLIETARVDMVLPLSSGRWRGWWYWKEELLLLLLRVGHILGSEHLKRRWWWGPTAQGAGDESWGLVSPILPLWDMWWWGIE